MTLPQSPLVFFPLFRSLSFSIALHYLNAWNRLSLTVLCLHRKKKDNSIGQQIGQDGQEVQVLGKQGLSAEH